ncbi:MAG TPA: 30S ribosomal protein S13 [bacterium]|nr:30S ribosomal protein S13 [bacterium]
MARIAGVDLPREKRIEAALPYIFGVGSSRARQILAATNVNPDTRVRNLTEEEVTRLREFIDRGFKVEGDLRRDIAMDIRRLQEIGSFRGQRHRKSLPVRGQRTRTNARTRKGKKKTVSSGRRKMEKK